MHWKEGSEDMNAADIVILLVIAAIAWFCIISLRNGSASCSTCGSCSSCSSGSCKWTKDIQKAQRAIEKEKRLQKSSL